MCPAGYVMHQHTNQTLHLCECNHNESNILFCEDDQEKVFIKVCIHMYDFYRLHDNCLRHTIHLCVTVFVTQKIMFLSQKGKWAVFVPSQPQANMEFYPCPVDYCRCTHEGSVSNTICVYSYTHSDPNLQCSCDRKGQKYALL